MKIGRILPVLAISGAIFGFFVACIELSEPDPTYTPTYTVKFEANGGAPIPQQQTVAYKGKIIEPDIMTKTGYVFGGWYKESALINLWDFDYDTVISDTTLYAKWGFPIIVPGTTLAEKFQWLTSNATSYTFYIIEVASSEELTRQDLFKKNITVQLKGIGGLNTITLTNENTGSLFLVYKGVTLILDNVVLVGRNNTGMPLVNINGGNLIMNQEVMISGNTNHSDSGGGGVGVSGGTFIMNGGEISGNTRHYKISREASGGGVSVNGGTFIMNGGKISGNTVIGSDDYPFISRGGGVYVSAGIFIMNGGEISGNTIPSSYSSSGGGISVGDDGTFTMSGGKISGNTAFSDGGGVYMSRGTFTMSGGEISGNIALSDGGGVYVSSGTFTMSDGEISNNTAGSSGGGVYLYGDRNTLTFNKTGGIITGYSTDMVNGNVVKNDDGVIRNYQGHAVFLLLYNSSKRKETTAGSEDNLSYSRDSSQLNPPPPVWDGAWDN